MQEFLKGENGYTEARQKTVWNARKPDRFPDVIVQAESDADVIEAVRAARAAGRGITVRSGGHSWGGHQLRDGVTLIDLSKLNSVVSVDKDAMVAVVEPGCYGNDALLALDELDLFFPIGHCKGVGIGGFLLQGGFGWNGRALGPSCMSVLAIDVVTADGDLVHASPSENPDLYWAARGSGPGFFGVVLRFHLRVHPKSHTIANGVFTYELDVVEDVYTWLDEIGPKVGLEMELMALMHTGFDGQKEIAVTGPVFADSEERAREVLSILETCPVLDRAKLAMPYLDANVPDMTAGVYMTYPDNHRYGVDNMWTHASASELMPGLKKIAETIKDAPTHMLWMNWAPDNPGTPERPDMAFSVEDKTYIAAYGVWEDEANDADYESWATDRMREMEHLSTGIQLADENLANRTARFLSDENYARYDSIRSTYDPDHVFQSWSSRP